MTSVVVVILVTLLQHASRAAPVPSGKHSSSNRLAGDEVVCCKSRTMLLNMIAFHDGLGYGNESSSGFPWLLRASDKKNTSGSPRPSPLIPLYAAWRAHLGEVFMVKQKKNEKQRFWNVFPLLCCSFYFPTWMSRLFRSLQGSVLPSSQGITQPGDGPAGLRPGSVCTHTHSPSPGCPCMCLGFTLK